MESKPIAADLDDSVEHKYEIEPDHENDTGRPTNIRASNLKLNYSRISDVSGNRPSMLEDHNHHVDAKQPMNHNHDCHEENHDHKDIKANS